MNQFHASAFILNSIKYGEKKIISRAFTDTNGLVSFIASIGKKSQRLNCFQAFTPVELDLKKTPSASLYIAQKVSLQQNLIFDPSSIAVCSIRFFLAELLNKVIKEEEQNVALFSLLKQTAAELSRGDIKGLFILNFLSKLLEIMGITPSIQFDSGYFDLKEGELIVRKPEHPNYLNNVDTLLLANWIKGVPPSTKKDRRSLLNCILLYLDIQLDAGVSNLKSKQVLEALFQ